MDNETRVTVVVVAHLVAIVLLASAGGCVTDTSRDVTDRVAEEPWLATGYRMGAVYELVAPCFVLGASNDATLVRPGGPFPFIQDFEASPMKRKDIRGVARSGTRLRPQRLVYTSSGGGLGDVVDACAAILDPPFTGWEVRLFAISGRNFDTPVFLAIPDKRFIREVTPPTNTPSAAAPE